MPDNNDCSVFYVFDRCECWKRKFFFRERTHLFDTDLRWWISFQEFFIQMRRKTRRSFGQGHGMALAWVKNQALVWVGIWYGFCMGGKPCALLGRGMAWRLCEWKTKRSFGQGYGMALAWVENQALVWAGTWYGSCMGGKPGARLGRNMAYRLCGRKIRRSFG